LPKLPNGVGDRWYPNGVQMNVGKVILNGSENWNMIEEQTDTIRFNFNAGTPELRLSFNNAISNYIPLVETTFGIDVEGFMSLAEGLLYIRILKSRLSSNDVAGFKSWLSQHNIEIYYQLTTSTFDNSKTFPEFIDFYDGGSVIVDDGIVDYTVVENQATINYIEGNITTVVDNQFKISKPTKIISKSNDLYEYDLSNLPSYLEYGTLPAGTYDNALEFINNNQNKEIKIFFDDNIQEDRYNTYLENDTIIISNDTEFIRIYNNNTYTSIRNLDTNITYKLEGYNIIDYIDGEFDNTVLAFFWVIPILLVGGLFYLLLTKRKE
jgi:hypothetical protein